jgi:hypothetical protein
VTGHLDLPGGALDLGKGQIGMEAERDRSQATPLAEQLLTVME